MENSSRFGRSESLVLNSNTFARFGNSTYEDAMTIRGAVTKTQILLGIVIVSAGCAWRSIPHDAGVSGFPVWLGTAMLGAFAIGLITAINERAAPITAPLYAVLEGGVLGGISAVFEAYYPGVVFPAVVLTFGTLFSLLAVCGAWGFQLSGAFLRGVLAATMSIALIYLSNILLRLVGLGSIPFLFDGGFFGILFSLFVILIAAVNLVLDFELIESGARQGAPKYMEWYAAYGLMVTLIWLYLEVLKLVIQIAASGDED